MEGHPVEEWRTSWVTRQGHPEEARGKWRVTWVKNGALLGLPDINGGSKSVRMNEFILALGKHSIIPRLEEGWSVVL